MNRILIFIFLISTSLDFLFEPANVLGENLKSFADFIPAYANDNNVHSEVNFTPYGRCLKTPVQRGLWVEVEGKNRPFDSAESFETFQRMLELPFTDLYLQVYRRGVSWFNSDVADATPYSRAKAHGLEDPIRKAIDLAHLKGKKAHAWLNMLRIDQNRKAQVFKEGGNNSVVVDSCGRSLITYAENGFSPYLKGCKVNQLDTPGIWLDPGNLGVREFYLKLIEELLTKYPDLDGIHFDMIRYPFPMGGTSINTTNIEEQRTKLTELVTELSRKARSINNNICMTAAVLAWRDRAERNSLQDWPSWINQGILDYVIPMAYTSDLSKYQKLIADYQNLAPTKIVPGVGGWLIHEKKRSIAPFLNLSGDLGYVIFSYSNLLNKRSLEDLRIIYSPSSLAEKSISK